MGNPTEEPDPGGGCNAAALFQLLWVHMTELLGTAATAAILRRSLRRAAARDSELLALRIERDGLEYRHVVPPSWSTDGDLRALRVFVGELRPILFELTGPIVLQRLHGVPDLARYDLFPSPREPENDQ